jgi:hypothetical protein
MDAQLDSIAAKGAKFRSDAALDEREHGSQTRGDASFAVARIHGAAPAAPSGRYATDAQQSIEWPKAATRCRAERDGGEECAEPPDEPRVAAAIVLTGYEANLAP